MDLRMKRTRKMLRDALWEAIMEKGFEGLTVSEVCERAMINRATFYRHYEDINDLLLRGIDEVFDEIYALGEPAYPPEELARYELTGPPRNFILFINFVGERADFFRLMLSDRGIPAFITRLRAYVEELILERIHVSLRRDSTPLVPVELIARGWAGQIMGMLIWWLEKGQKITAENMAIYLTAVVFHTIYECLDMDIPVVGFDLKAALREINEHFYNG